MKKLLFLLIIPLFFACGSDDEDNTQDYTSIVVENKTDIKLSNVTIAYLKDDIYIKVTSWDELSPKSKTNEFHVNSNSKFDEVYIFFDYSGTKRLNKAFEIQTYKTNILTMVDMPFTNITDKSDATQYPQ
ncbi:hypothetical protein [Dysgonomonas massiliensis]|uniref:hypothetical protein n=1 Tax=Dysgonomonas massiliensis TaxID=2040292 RepID=UPI000C78C8C4|nr:hypothetical protein [Dysgonomonas massiliensis]